MTDYIAGEHYWIKEKRWNKWHIVRAMKVDATHPGTGEFDGFLFEIIGDEDFVFYKEDFVEAIHIPFPGSKQ